MRTTPAPPAAGVAAPLLRRSAAQPPGRVVLILLVLCLIVAAPLVALLSFSASLPTACGPTSPAPCWPTTSATAVLLCARRGARDLGTGAGAAWLVTMYASRCAACSTGHWSCRWPCRPTSWPMPIPTSCRSPGRCSRRSAPLTGWGVATTGSRTIRSLGGAVFVLSAVLYPYVYVLARAAFTRAVACARSRSAGRWAARPWRPSGASACRWPGRPSPPASPSS